jgi:site-specific DNA-methyltransferase (adenine-specific)
MRVETIGDATVYLGDSLEIIPMLKSVDAVITDPPYSSGGRTIGERTKSTSQKYQSTGLKSYFADFAGDNKDQRSWMLWMSLWLSRAMERLSDGGMVCLFSDWRQLPACTDALQIAGLVWRGIVVWDKVNARPMPDRFRAQAEYIAWGTNGQRDFEMKTASYHDGVFSIKAPSTSERQHSTQKPVELMDRLVEIARPGEVILDPFMGSGTTGVSAMHLGRRFIGCELVPHYFDVACTRIEAAYKEAHKAEKKPLSEKHGT